MPDASSAINPNSMSIIVTIGSLVWAYPPFFLGTTAAAMGHGDDTFTPTACRCC
jgi:peroxiredoxin family protein